MKKLISLAGILLTFLLAGCEGSDTYQGDWKAQSTEGLKASINFSPNSFTISGDSIDSQEIAYTQNSVQWENTRLEYGLNLETGNTIRIIFPNSKNEDRAAMVDSQGSIIYLLGRNEYLEYDEVFGLAY